MGTTQHDLELQRKQAEIDKLKSETDKITSEIRYNKWKGPIFTLAPLFATIIVLLVSNIFDANSKLTEANKKLLEIQKYQLDAARSQYSKDSIQLITQKNDLKAAEIKVTAERSKLKNTQDSLIVLEDIIVDRSKKLTKDEHRELNFKIRFENLLHDSAYNQKTLDQAISKIQAMYRPIRLVSYSFRDDPGSAKFEQQYSAVVAAYFDLRNTLHLSQPP